MEKVRIAYIEQDSGIGGAEVNLLYLLERMDREKFRPVVIVPFEGPLTSRLKELAVPHEVIPRAKFISTSKYIFGKKIFNPFAVLYDILVFVPAILKIKKFLVKKKINVVHTNSMVAHIYGAIAAKLAGVPCIWHMQDIVDPRMAFGLVRRSLLFLGERLPARIAAISRAVGDMFQGMSADKLQVIYNGTDCTKFSPRVDGAGVRRELGIGKDERVVGMVGRLTQWKGHKEFLKAAARVSERLPDTRFLVVGDTTFSSPEFRDELVQLVKVLKIESRVIFTGGRNDIPALLRAMDVLIHASVLPEPFGLVIVEGMSAGVPVIAANQGGPLEIITTAEDGFLVDPHKTNELARTIIRLLEDEPLRRRIAEAGRRKVARCFTVEKFVQQFERLYCETAV